MSTRRPYYQSFMELRVEPRRGVICLISYYVHDPLRWSHLKAAPGRIPAGEERDSFAEWVVRMDRQTYTGTEVETTAEP
jgi:hypothetical protein